MFLRDLQYPFFLYWRSGEEVIDLAEKRVYQC